MADGTEMNVEAERAAFEAWAERNAIRTDLGAWDAWFARAAQPADVGAGDLPEPFDCVDMASGDTKFVYSADQMRQYARDAIAADRRAREAAGNALNDVLPTEHVTVTNYGNPVDKSAPEVKIERGRVWIVRGNQSFMLAYEPDDNEPEATEWYANQLRGVLSGFTPCVNSTASGEESPQAAPGVMVGTTVAMPGSGGGFTMCAFNASDVPIGTKLYAAPPLSSEQQAEKGEGACGS